MSSFFPDTPSVIDAIKLDGPGMGSKGAPASYRVIEPRSGEKRAQIRRRTRLRSGKVLSAGNRFIADCRIFDRTAVGVRVRLCNDVLLPLRVRLFDDEQQILADADIVWRQDREIGLCIISKSDAAALRPELLSRLRGKYYAVP